ncbi:MAG: hypothetical protein COA83_05675 [Methylophaga sp.]|nr:MAG: hypothetical protein COA83_05675 [Methylophaga sp.]
MDFAITMNKQFYLIFIALAFSMNVWADCDFDDFPIMDEMKVQSVLDDANYNNRPMMVRSFLADASYLEVVAHYHKVWDERYDDTAFGIWHQVTTITDDCMMTVQIAAQHAPTSSGRLIISNPPQGSPQAKLGEGVLAPADTRVVSDLITNDGSKQGRTTMLTSAESAHSVAAFYLSEMQSKGWHLQRNFMEGSAHALVFRDGLDISNIVILPTGDNKTQILINEVITQ